MVRLERVNERTFRAVVDMKLPPEQNCFVAPNVVSLAQAWLYGDKALPMAVLHGDEVVGFLMLDWDEDERTVGIWRFMIAPEHQRKGYGREALEAVLALARASANVDLAHLDYVPKNTIARELYYSLGFRENGVVDDGEIVMTLPLRDNPQIGSLAADEDDIQDLLSLLADAGMCPPAGIASEDALREAVLAKRVVRLTLLGETVGLAYDGALLLSQSVRDRHEEAHNRLRAKGQAGF